MSCPPQTPIARGQALTVEIDWTNTGTQTYAFDVVFLIRVPGTQDWVGVALKDQTLAPGQSTTSKLTLTIPLDFPTGVTDGVAVIGDLTDTQFSAVYAELPCYNSLNIT